MYTIILVVIGIVITIVFRSPLLFIHSLTLGLLMDLHIRLAQVHNELRELKKNN